MSGWNSAKKEEAYVSFIFESGDGWFEKIAFEYGFEIRLRDSCCYMREKEGSRYCGNCGAGLNGHVVYTRPRF